MANEYGNFMDSSFNQDTIWNFGACVIRLDPGTVAGGGAFSSGGPRILADENHIAVGAISVAVNASGNIVITTDGGVAPIGACLIGADESLSAKNALPGPSEGPTSTVVVIGQGGAALNLTTQTAWDAVAGTSTNLWCFWAGPVFRGVGQPSIAQQCLDLINDNILPRIAALEGN
jgi:hypothetical protein